MRHSRSGGERRVSLAPEKRTRRYVSPHTELDDPVLMSHLVHSPHFQHMAANAAAVMQHIQWPNTFRLFCFRFYICYIRKDNLSDQVFASYYIQQRHMVSSCNASGRIEVKVENSIIYCSRGCTAPSLIVLCRAGLLSQCNSFQN